MEHASSPPIHLEIQRHRNNCYGLLRTSYRESGKIRHTTHGRITGFSHEKLKLIQAALRNEVVYTSSNEAPKIANSREYGASQVILCLAKGLELDKMLYSKNNLQWVKDCLAMIIGRLIYAGSKLSLTNRYKDTVLWELCGVKGIPDVDENCYSSMDRLLERQQDIQQKLAAKHFSDNAMVLYDITSSYFEGEYSESQIVKFGYNRDCKRGHEQIVIGLICNMDGCPIAVEVFAGNTKDETTVKSKIEEIEKRYKIKQIIFVGDLGMVTKSNIGKIKKEGFHFISALTHPQIKELLSKKVLAIKMFDHEKIIEMADADNPEYRYCLCRNKATGKRETITRQELLKKTTTALDKIANSPKKSTTKETAARVGKIFGSTKMGKFIEWEVNRGRLKWSLKTDFVEAESNLDGCYIIVSDAPKDKFNSEKLVQSYKQLRLVEQAFRNLKTVQLEIRPVYHKTDIRIRSHVFLCMLAYYLQWNMNQKLKPLFEKDGNHKKHFWTFENVIERLKSIRIEEIHTAGTTCKIITQLDEDQRTILNLLGAKL